MADLPVARPAHLNPWLVGLPFVGGSLGTLARWTVGALVPHSEALPVSTLAVNLVGAFALGLLLAGLARGGPDEGGRRAFRVTLGSGFCGGFTTYSALSVETHALLRTGLTGTAFAYAVGTVVLGVVATAAGFALVSRARGPGRGQPA